VPILDAQGPDIKSKRRILLGLSDALSALSDRMRSQGDAARKITVLAVRAEGIAQRSWDLNSTNSRNFQRDSQALMDEVKTLAKDATDAATRAGEEALLGRDVANAIARHSEDIAALARDIDILPDASAVRARLRPLSTTLSTLPERLKANAATIMDVTGIATLASGLAERGDRFAAGGIAANQEAVAMCRDLRRFAEEATAVSLEMSRGSALALQAINDMAKKTVGLSRGKLISDAPVTAHDRLMALARDVPPVAEVWVSVPPKSGGDALPTNAKVWGATPLRKT
jgi:hypothetical protein